MSRGKLLSRSFPLAFPSLPHKLQFPAFHTPIKNAAIRRHFYFENQLLVLLALLGALALLVRDAAAGLASRLAGSLALAASAVLSAVAKISGFNSLNVFHNTPP